MSVKKGVKDVPCLVVSKVNWDCLQLFKHLLSNKGTITKVRTFLPNTIKCMHLMTHKAKYFCTVCL